MNISAATSGLQTVGTQERNHVATRQPLNRRTEVRFHHLPEQPAELNDVVVIPFFAMTFSAFVSTSCATGTTTLRRWKVTAFTGPRPVLGLDPDKRPRQRSV